MEDTINVNADTNQNQDNCTVCLNAFTGNEQERTWTCSCCQNKCHMLCIFQWTLRLSLNSQGQATTSFSCPSCRTIHAITTLPGFEQTSSTTTTTTTTTTRRSRRRPRRPRRRQMNESAAELLQRAFGLVAETETGEENDEEQEDEYDHEHEHEHDHDHQDEDEDEDEDGEYVEEEEYEMEEESERNRVLFSLSTGKMMLDFDTLNIHINTGR